MSFDRKGVIYGVNDRRFGYSVRYLKTDKDPDFIPWIKDIGLPKPQRLTAALLSH